ncbi:acetate/propionate family kinase [Zunongwangia sp. HGR-M22]|uniref:acetate/propionate family kinase n=1 Tax=Zunongwangia sp. HGR-M22 TaxID=3015168 RepID=UPI0022DDF8EA|nr:acetate kinase [Zunongwangia sp. HGR-M22]WBL24188.1 acetate kinase [Zunongwangia sp. HGR-M22]
MNILVINSGSSSIKYQLIKMPEETVAASGLVERIGLDKALIHYNAGETKLSKEVEIPDHETGLKRITTFLMDSEVGVIEDENHIQIVGHRVVHGGKSLTKTVEVTAEVKEEIRNVFPLAPLHNPHNLRGIEVAEKVFANAKQVVVFDTAFFHTMPQKAYQYAIPKKFMEENAVRSYGFHGTSHKYVSEKAIEYLNEKGLPSEKIITVHLGNGCSITAIKDGIAIDHSLGMGPANGLIMGTRAGDIDQSVIFYLIDKLGYTPQQVNDILLKESGMLGLTGYSDMRDIEEKSAEGDETCRLALYMNGYRIKKYIGSYIAALNGVDAIVFTAGIGENSSVIRKIALEDMEYLGLHLDHRKNDVRGKTIRPINPPEAKTKILVVPTNEELEIAKQSYALVN